MTPEPTPNRFNVRLAQPAGLPALRRELDAMGIDQSSVESEVHTSSDIIRLDRVPNPVAAELATRCASSSVLVLAPPPGTARAEEGPLLLVGPRGALAQALEHLAAAQTPGAAAANEILAAIGRLAGADTPICRIGPAEFDWGARTYIMGIVNVTPDSFSGDGLLATGVAESAIAAAVRQAHQFVEQGADIIDVGGESTRPGAEPVDAQTETERVVPVIERLHSESDAVISVDTYKASVAAAALAAGAHMVNDIWALEGDPEMPAVVSTAQVPVVLMHNRSRRARARQHPALGGHYVDVSYGDLMGDILADLRRVIDGALAAGIAASRIIIDPGIGFGKTVAQNLEVLNRVGELRVLGLPILLGTSRKSFIGHVLNLPPEERLEGTAATVALGILRRGADIVRVHDVRAIARVARMVDAAMRAGME